MRTTSIWFAVLIALLLICRCKAADDRVSVVDTTVSKTPQPVEFEPPPEAVKVAADIFVMHTKKGSGVELSEVPDGDGLLVLTVYGTAPGSVVASVEEFTRESLDPWWAAALENARVGDERRVWLCGGPGRKQWETLHKQRCVTVDLELITHSEHGSKPIGTH